MNIYLISRTEAKLQAAATEIAQQFGVETKYYAADLVAAGTEPHDGSCWFGLKSNVCDMDIGILVNNAGMSYAHSEYFHDVDPETLNDIVRINASALMKMTYTVLPGMIERGRGCIVNISSGVASAVPAAALVTVYTASKSFVNSFSKALAIEYRPQGIDIQVRLNCGHVH
jgi:17beta-estradiol 17-dehydrogenase / very-long-chain 3-oxoacyl-CoA reductase